MIKKIKKNLVYTPIDLPEYNFDYLREILFSNELRWSFQNDRGAAFLPVYSFNYRRKKMEWFRIFKKDTILQEYVEENILPLCDPAPDIHILRSLAGCELPVHVDCSNVNYVRRNPIYKLRIVIAGNPESLYFQDYNAPNNRRYIPNKFKAYILNGTAIHGMITKIDKLVFAVGWPWKNRGPELDNFLHKNIQKHKDHVIMFDQIDNGTLDIGMLDTMRYSYDKN